MTGPLDELRALAEHRTPGRQVVVHSVSLGVLLDRLDQLEAVKAVAERAMPLIICPHVDHGPTTLCEIEGLRRALAVLGPPAEDTR